MLNTLSRKALRDLLLHKGRTSLVIAAIAVGVIATGSILTAYSVVTREIERNYADTTPAAIIITASDSTTFSPELAAVVLEQPEVQAVERRRTVTARLLGYEGEWKTASLLVVEDFSNLQVATFYPDSGGWDPGPGEVLIERSSLDEVPLAIGDNLSLQVAGLEPATLTVSGLTHDPGRLPGWLAGQVVGYISEDGAKTLGLGPGFDELLIATPVDQTRQQNSLVAHAVLADAVLADAVLTDASVSEGLATEHLSIEVPIPGEHPADGVMTTMLFLLQAFGLLSLLTGGALVATMITAQLKQQSQELGAMKALGGSTRQIASIYFGSVLMLTTVALAIGIPLGLLLGRGFVGFTFGLLNFEVESYALSWWVIPAQVLLAALIPALSIALPVRKAARQSVHSLLSANEASASIPNGFISKATGSLGTATSFGLRNALRSRSRSLLSIGALALGGASFMVALNTGVAWDRAVDDEFAARSYDLAVQLDQEYTASEIDAAFDSGSGADAVEAVEIWSRSAATIELPSGSQGSAFDLLVAPADTEMISYPIMEGRWLEPSDRNALVVSQTLTDPAPAVGSTVSITSNGKTSDAKVVGIVRQLSGGSSGVAYASTYPSGSAQAGFSGNHLRIELSPSARTAGGLADVEASLDAANVNVARIATAEEGREALDDHLIIIVGLLGLMATLVAIVAGFGLIEAMSISVLERRREIGVMRAVGAPTRTVLAVVTVEGVLLATLSWMLALVLSVPASSVVQRVAGEMFLEAPLELSFSTTGMAAWLLVVVVLAAIASAIPALESTEVPVHEALSYPN